jgi:hypothetical protein
VAKDFKLDIFRFLEDIGSKGDAYAKLSEEERKGFAPVVVQRWLTGVKDERQLIALNAFANKYVFALSKHPHLIARLFQACVSKVPRRYFWLGVKSKAKAPLRDAALKQHFGWSSNELRRQTILPSATEVLALAENLGWQKDELAKLKRELKDG